MKIFKFCNKYILKYKFSILIYVLLTLIITAIGIASPYITGSFLDNLIAGGSLEVVIRFCIIFGSLSLSKIILGYATSLLYIKTQANLSYEINRDTIEHIQNLSLSFIQNSDAAGLNQKVNYDASRVITFCISILQNVIVNVGMFLAPFIILLRINWFVAIILIVFLVLYITLYFVFKKPLYKAGFELKESQASFFSSLYEQFSYIKLIKTNAIQKTILKRLDGKFKILKGKVIKNQHITYVFSGLDGFISTIAQIVLFIVGGIQILNGNFTIGQFTIFSSYFTMMLGASRYFFNLGAGYQDVLVSYNRLCDIYDRNVESYGNELLSGVQNITLSNVNFKYGDKRVLEGFSQKFEKGNIYSISGANGAGKSTLINLILGLYIDEKKGDILYNDTSINDLDMNYIRENLIGFAEQEPYLINDSIKYNLTFNNKADIDDAKINKYVNILNMQAFISNLEDGIDTIITEKNTNISGGEKQKISILKVLLKDTPVMIFDEPTSALDFETTKKFAKYLQETKKERIVLLITHDSYIKDVCDCVIHI